MTVSDGIVANGSECEGYIRLDSVEFVMMKVKYWADTENVNTRLRLRVESELLIFDGVCGSVLGLIVIWVMDGCDG